MFFFFITFQYNLLIKIIDISNGTTYIYISYIYIIAKLQLYVNQEFFILPQKINLLFLILMMMHSKPLSQLCFILEKENYAGGDHHDEGKTENSD